MDATAKLRNEMRKKPATWDNDAHRVSMRQVLPSLAALLLALSLAPACAGDPQQLPECEGNCDEAPAAESALVDCWLEASESEDDFFRLDKLHCSYQPEFAALDINSVAMDVILADGNREGVLFRESNAGTDIVVTGIQSDQFPLELSVQISLGISDRNDDIIGSDVVRQTRQTIVLEGLADATLEAPLQISLPFDLMALDLLNRHDGEALVEFGHEIVMGSETVAVDKTHQVRDFGFRNQVVVAVSKGAETIGATTVLRDTAFQSSEVGRHEAVYRGAGTYEISLDATRRVEGAELVEPQGHVVSLCRLLTNSVPAPETCTEDCLPTVTNTLHCFGNSVPGVEDNRHLRILPSVAEGETADPIEVDFSADGDVMVSLDVDQLPAQVEVHSVLSDAASGLTRLETRSHVATKVVSAEDDEFNAHLPFRIWTIEVEASDDVLFARLQPDERFLELGYQWEGQFALRIFDDQDLSIQPAAPASLVIAVPADADSITATLEIIDQQGAQTTIPVVISHGSWRVNTDSISALD